MLHAKLRDELSHEYGGEDKCPWSAIEIKGIYQYCSKLYPGHWTLTKSPRNYKQSSSGFEIQLLINLQKLSRLTSSHQVPATSE